MKRKRSSGFLPIRLSTISLVCARASGGATTTICELLARYGLAVPDSRVEKCVDIGVRSAISHLMFPTEEPEVLAEHLGWMAGRLLFADERAAAP